ncbi:hypothetical protein AOLI_G00160250 [Acnodon oligacanthus]
MVLISVLNGIIASQLLRMFREAAQDNRICVVGGNATMLSVAVEPNRAQSLRHGVMVLHGLSERDRVAPGAPKFGEICPLESPCPYSLHESLLPLTSF